MNRSRPYLVACLALLAVVIVALPAAATEGTTEEETVTTTIAPEPVFENGEPAVVVPPVEAAEDEQPWTARFIYPTIVVVTILLIVGLAIGYNRSIRNRYVVVSDE
ncbi:MAG TPA: hypothetical protein VLA29_05705 [Acidimicrobiia bacterium]|nr:hypothetical protein [Acidimicrobiia bacterium]